jgi:hypothetical protein
MSTEEREGDAFIDGATQLLMGAMLGGISAVSKEPNETSRPTQPVVGSNVPWNYSRETIAANIIAVLSCIIVFGGIAAVVIKGNTEGEKLQASQNVRKPQQPLNPNIVYQADLRNNFRFGAMKTAYNLLANTDVKTLEALTNQGEQIFLIKEANTVLKAKVASPIVGSVFESEIIKQLEQLNANPDKKGNFFIINFKPDWGPEQQDRAYGMSQFIVVEKEGKNNRIRYIFMLKSGTLELDPLNLARDEMTFSTRYPGFYPGFIVPKSSTKNTPRADNCTNLKRNFPPGIKELLASRNSTRPPTEQMHRYASRAASSLHPGNRTF